MNWWSWWSVAGLALGLSACTVDRGARCQQQSNCVRSSGEGGAYCSNEGYCRQECQTDIDCPCNAICAGSCGVCIAVDLDASAVSRATCFTATVEFSEVLGACRGDLSMSSSLLARVGRPGCVPATTLSCSSGYVGGRLEIPDATTADGGADGACDASDVCADADAGGDARADVVDANTDAVTDASADAVTDASADAGEG